MELEDHSLRFEPSAYLQRLLGRELISNEYLAVAELVKNAYDAGATRVTIELEREQRQRMVISDNGLGMSLDELERLWMVPGYSEKPDKKHLKVGSTKRILLGEKGIGRFACDKLARKLTLVTKKVNDPHALIVIFDWDKFEDRTKKLVEIPIPYTLQKSEDIRLNGTRLELEGLRKEWDGHDWTRLRNELQNLVSPFRKVRGFNIQVRAKGWISEQIRSPFETQPGYRYEFSLGKGNKRKRTIVRPKKIADALEKPVEKKESVLYGGTFFGPLLGSFFYVDYAGALTKRGFDPGIGIYRNGFRVEPYGRPQDDWLGVKSTKASRHGHAPITPSRLFGFVEITREDNAQLKDMTNREGLIDNAAFKEFQDFVNTEFKYFADIVGDEKPVEESKAIKAQRAKETRDARQKTWDEIASQLAHQLRQPLEVIGLEAGTLERWLQRKEMLEDDAKEAVEAIKLSVKDIDDHIRLMQSRARSAQAPIVRFDVVQWSNDKIDRFRRKAEVQNTNISLHSERESHEITFSREALGFVLENFIENALSAVSQIKKRSREIKLIIEFLDKNDICRVIVRDNGDGVAEALVDRLFAESVPSQTGTGFGLFYSRDVVKENGGHVGFENLKPYGSSFFVEIRNQEINDE